MLHRAVADLVPIRFKVYSEACPLLAIPLVLVPTQGGAMQLKLNRSEFVEKGFFGRGLQYLLEATLLVTPDEEAAIKRLGFWKKEVRPLTREEEREGNYDLEVMGLKTFADLVKGFKISGSLLFIEEMEQDIAKACKVLKHHMTGGDAGERVVDI